MTRSDELVDDSREAPRGATKVPRERRGRGGTGNLRPFRPGEEAREMGRRGGLRSGEVRREIAEVRAEAVAGLADAIRWWRLQMARLVEAEEDGEEAELSERDWRRMVVVTDLVGRHLKRIIPEERAEAGTGDGGRPPALLPPHVVEGLLEFGRALLAQGPPPRLTARDEGDMA